jgi:hypothetical protein
MGTCVADSTDEEGEGSEAVEVSGSSAFRDSSDIADSLAESPIVTFGDRGNSLRNSSETEGVEVHDAPPDDVEEGYEKARGS